MCVHFSTGKKKKMLLVFSHYSFAAADKSRLCADRVQTGSFRRDLGGIFGSGATDSTADVPFAHPQNLPSCRFLFGVSCLIKASFLACFLRWEILATATCGYTTSSPSMSSAYLKCKSSFAHTVNALCFCPTQSSCQGSRTGRRNGRQSEAAWAPLRTRTPSWRPTWRAPIPSCASGCCRFPPWSTTLGSSVAWRAATSHGWSSSWS